MSQKYLIRIAELERLLSEQAEALRQKDQQLSLVEETEAFLRSALTRAEEKIEEDEREIEHLRAQIEKLRRMLFGTRSEKLRREVELAEALLKQREQDSDRYSGREDDPQVPRQLRQSRHRRPLPAHLPREIHRLEPEESCCPECGGELDYLGEVSAEQLELVSSALKVIRTERVKKACTKCDCIVEAPAPSRPIERGIAGPGLLARVLTGKYCEHLPLYRQSEIFARQGVELSRALLSNWVDACCQLMTPVNDALYRYVMNTRKIHTDDTPVKVLAPGQKKAKTGRIWTYVRDDRNVGSSSPPAVWFAYSPNRQGKQPPWFEHDQMTVAAKILLRCTWLDPAEKEARRLHLQGMTVPDYTVKVRKWFCVMCDEDYEGEKCCPRCGTGVYSRDRGAAGGQLEG